MISFRVVRKPWTTKRCESCREELPPGEMRVELYGMAHRGDPPYRVAVHARPDCVGADWERIEPHCNGSGREKEEE